MINDPCEDLRKKALEVDKKIEDLENQISQLHGIELSNGKYNFSKTTISITNMKYKPSDLLKELDDAKLERAQCWKDYTDCEKTV